MNKTLHKIILWIPVLGCVYAYFISARIFRRCFTKKSIYVYATYQATSYTLFLLSIIAYIFYRLHTN